jgi:glycosyltransferase involved in cell wall biosynthesis
VVWGNHPSPTADEGALFALVSGRPWVATYHADVSDTRWWQRAYHRWEMRLLRRAALVLVTSDAYREALVGRGVPRERIVVVPTGPYIGDGTVPKTARRGAGAAPVAPFLVGGGRDPGHAYKRLELLIGSISALAEEGTPARLNVVGDGSRRPEFERLASEYGVSDRVQFLGRVDDVRLAGELAEARALVLPATSASEGFGTVAIEALQYGCPVVASTALPIGATLAAGGAALLFDALHPEELTRQLRTLRVEPGPRSKLSAGAEELAPSFSWEVLLPQVTSAVRRLLPPVATGGAGP